MNTPSITAPATERNTAIAVSLALTPDSLHLRAWVRAQAAGCEATLISAQADPFLWQVTSGTPGHAPYTVTDNVVTGIMTCTCEARGYCKHMAAIRIPDYDSDPDCPACLSGAVWLYATTAGGAFRCAACGATADFTPDESTLIAGILHNAAWDDYSLRCALLNVWARVQPLTMPRRRALADAGCAARVRPPAFNDAWDALYEGGR